MKKKNYLRGLVVAAVTVALAGAGTGAYAVTTAAGPSVVNVAGPDHQRLARARTVMLTASGTTSSIDETYVVNIWY